MYNNFEISLVVFMPNITTTHAITYTNNIYKCEKPKLNWSWLLLFQLLDIVMYVKL